MRTIPLSRGLEAIVDDEDYEELAQWGWHATSGPPHYARRIVRGTGGSGLLLHHALIGKPPKGCAVDHINGNSLDNRRSNLRIVSWARNLRNRRAANSNNKSSGHLGIHRFQDRYWSVELWLNRKKHHVGYFKDLNEAIEARRQAELRIWGENSAAYA